MIATYWAEVLSAISLMIERPLEASPKLALLGYIKSDPKPFRKLTNTGLLMAKQQVAINWGGRHPQRKSN